MSDTVAGGGVHADERDLPARGAAAGKEAGIEMILDVPLELVVRLGQKKVLVKDLLRLGPNSIIELNKGVDEPLDLVVNDRVLARGEVVVVDDRLGIRIVDILPPRERIENLGRE
ncbi:flagellar motor switch protein FliN [Myxococcota bacterium]|nr:flagellar motor switch protein FliN [Myxococcota bacterium]